MALTSWSTANYLHRLSQVFNTYPFMVSSWCYSPSLAATQISICVSQESQTFNRRGQQALTVTTGEVTAQVTDGVGNSVAASTTGAGTSQWFHIFSEFISTTSRAALLNGGSRGTNGETRDPGASDSVHIGILQDHATAPWSGTGALGEISIWDGSGMSEANMDSLAGKLYNGSGATGQNPLAINAEATQPWTSKLVAYWRLYDMDERVGGLFPDLAGNGHDMTMVGTLTNWGGAQPPVDAAPSEETVPLINGLFVIPIVRPV